MENERFPPPTALATWRTRLAPWLSALQFKMRVEVPKLPTRDEMNSFWISVNYFVTENYDADSWTTMLEAFELLDLLARVDGRIGWALLLEMAEVDRVFRINEALLLDPMTASLKFALVLEDREMLVYVADAFEACCRMVDVDYRPVRKREFLAVERLLLDAWSEKHGGEQFNRAVQGRIPIMPVLSVEDSSAVPKFDPFVDAIHHARVRWSRMDDDERRLVTNPFAVPTVAIKLLSSDQSCVEVVDSLLNVADRNIPITCLELHPALVDDDRADRLFKKLLCPTSGQFGVQRFEVTSRNLTDGVISALCKALAHSRGLEEFHWNASSGFGGHCAVDWHWTWLVNALFRSDSSHDIRSVTLRVDDLESFHIDAIREMLNNSAPFPFLQLGSVEIEERRQRHRSPITCLKLEYVNRDSRPAVLELLQLVGASLERLSLTHYSFGSFSNEFMSNVLAHCPRLKRLEITDAGMALDWLLGSPADLCGCEMLESLVLEGRMNHSTVAAFFQVLEDKDHSLTKTLKYLHWSVWGNNDPATAMMEAWLHMLEVNRDLEQSEIEMVDRGMSEYERDRYLQRFEAHNGENLADKRKLAFLSVLSPSNSSIPEMLELSTETIKLVMDFASYPKRRICG